jgi:hypothetical protein
MSAFGFSGGRAARPGSGGAALSPPAVGLWYTFVGSDLEASAAFADALRKGCEASSGGCRGEGVSLHAG